MSTSPDAIIIPFGKHKGATVAELLAKDPQYVDWVMAQGWVAQRFAELHAALATRGAGNDDTPEHNALQARFLDPVFRVALALVYTPGSMAGRKRHHDSAIVSRAIGKYVDELEEKKRLVTSHEDELSRIERMKRELPQEICQEEYRIKKIEDQRHQNDTRLVNGGKADYDISKARKARCERQLAEETTDEIIDNINLSIAAAKTAISEIQARKDDAERRAVAGLDPGDMPKIELDVQFEVNGVDLVVGTTNIELKPTVGDDFPSIMRQMRRLECKLLVAGEFTGRGVSEQQMRQMFEANGMKVLFVREIEAEIANARAWVAPAAQQGA